MHDTAMEFVSRFATSESVTVIEIGSRDINGSTRALFPAAIWIGLDLYEGPSVDWVGDCTNYAPTSPVNLVICTEVLEHAEQWEQILDVAATWLSPSGKIIITCAGPGRAPHSHHDGATVREGEYYGNLTIDQITGRLEAAGMTIVCAERGLTVRDVASFGTDSRVMAVKASENNESTVIVAATP